MRKSVQIAVFLIFMNATATLIGATGFDEVLGVSPDVGGDSGIETSQERADEGDISGGSAGAADLAAFAVSGASMVISSLKAITIGGPLMIQQAGVPAEFVAFGFAPFYLFVILDLYGMVKGGT